MRTGRAGRVVVQSLSVRPPLIILLLITVLPALAQPTTRPSSRPASRPTTQRTEKARVEKPKKYLPTTPEQNARAIDRYRATAREVESRLSVKFTEVQTDHFIIFTDWDPREFNFLKSNCESAYAAVSRQFEIPVKENVFVGKLPVFMFASQDDFVNYAKEFDNLTAGPTMTGYYAAHGDGTGRMAMWKPDVAKHGTLKRAELAWGYTLTHEFTHAFLDRYRSPRMIPRWINEGLAELIAQTQFKRPEKRTAMKEMARRDDTFEELFDDSVMPTFEYYPVMQGWVETLIAMDRKRFIAMIDGIKSGQSPEEALKEQFALDYPGLVREWRVYARKR